MFRSQGSNPVVGYTGRARYRQTRKNFQRAREIYRIKLKTLDFLQLVREGELTCANGEDDDRKGNVWLVCRECLCTLFELLNAYI